MNKAKITRCICGSNNAPNLEVVFPTCVATLCVGIPWLSADYPNVLRIEVWVLLQK